MLSSDFPGLRISVASMTLTASFHKRKLLRFMFSSTMAPKCPILVSQCEMDHQKPNILSIFGTLSLGGHHMRPKLNLKDKGQMSQPNEYTDITSIQI